MDDGESGRATFWVADAVTCLPAPEDVPDRLDVVAAAQPWVWQPDDRSRARPWRRHDLRHEREELAVQDDRILVAGVPRHQIQGRAVQGDKLLIVVVVVRIPPATL